MTGKERKRKNLRILRNSCNRKLTNLIVVMWPDRLTILNTVIMHLIHTESVSVQNRNLAFMPALSSGVKNILPITTAKVPIVKFYHVRTGLEGDISLYNTLVGPVCASLWVPVQ